MAGKRKVLNVVGPNIRASRNRLGPTQEELAVKCQVFGLDISRGTLSQIEAQIRCVKDAELWAFAQVLGLPTDSLFPTGMKKHLRN
jgi:transcriptional regulator with XRE-family HTH domain